MRINVVVDGTTADAKRAVVYNPRTAVPDPSLNMAVSCANAAWY